MAEAPEQADREAVRRFTSFEEFLQEFYPKSCEEQDARREAEGDGDFGIELALESLGRHAGILRFDV